jgi:preprotein translocase subunit SecG
MESIMMIATIIVAITLIAVVLIQGASSGLGSAFGGDSGIYRTRRGVEKTLFTMTISLSVLFLIMSLVTVAIG